MGNGCHQLPTRVARRLCNRRWGCAGHGGSIARAGLEFGWHSDQISMQPDPVPLQKECPGSGPKELRPLPDYLSACCARTIRTTASGRVQCIYACLWQTAVPGSCCAPARGVVRPFAFSGKLTAGCSLPCANTARLLHETFAFTTSTCPLATQNQRPRRRSATARFCPRPVHVWLRQQEFLVTSTIHKTNVIAVARLREGCVWLHISKNHIFCMFCTRLQPGKVASLPGSR